MELRVIEKPLLPVGADCSFKGAHPPLTSNPSATENTMSINRPKNWMNGLLGIGFNTIFQANEQEQSSAKISREAR